MFGWLHRCTMRYRLSRRFEGFVLETYCKDEEKCGRIGRAPGSVVIPYSVPITEEEFRRVMKRPAAW